LGLYKDGEVKELLKPDDTEDPQSTYTINRPSFAKHLSVQAHVGTIPQAFFLMTDGLSGDLLYSPDTAALNNWGQKVSEKVRLTPSLAQAAAGVLNWLASYQVTGSWDDRTLVVITAKEQEEETHGKC
jgi:hypothetical protein